MNKFLNAISYITLLAAAIFMFVCAFWLLYPYDPIDFYNLPHKVLNKKVLQGDVLSYEVDYCKHLDINPTVMKYFIDGLVYPIPPYIGVDRDVDKGCDKNNKKFIHSIVKMPIPLNLPTGEIKGIKTVLRYQVNPIRYIDVVTYTGKFIVTESTESAELRMRDY